MKKVSLLNYLNSLIHHDDEEKEIVSIFVIISNNEITVNQISFLGLHRTLQHQETMLTIILHNTTYNCGLVNYTGDIQSSLRNCVRKRKLMMLLLIFELKQSNNET